MNFNTSINCTSLNKVNNNFVFPKVTIDTIGMFLLRVNVFSNDKQHTIKATSKNIRITSFDISDNSLYYNNLEMKFNGTFNQSEKYSYIAKIYNYFLENYDAELIGPIDSLSGSIIFGGGLDLSNLTAASLLIDGTINQTEIIIGDLNADLI